MAIAAAEREAARGNAIQAGLPIYNPVLNAAVGPRLSSGAVFVGIQVGVSQTFERGGKREARRNAAGARLQAETFSASAAARLARVEAWRAYELAVVARMRVEAAVEAETAARDVTVATQQAQALGSETQLRLNLAAADLGRARHDLADAENSYATAIALLASAVGARSDERVEPADGDLVFAAPPSSGADAATRAVAARPEVARAQAQAVAAAADVQAADATAAPDVTLGVTYGYDPDADTKTQWVLLGGSVSLPVRNRNQGERAATRALAKRAQLEQRWLVAEVERTARLAYDRYSRASASLAAFDKDVSERLHENLQLATDSFRAGKIDFYAFTLARRDLIANRLAYLDALTEVIEGWSELTSAASLEVTR